MGTTRVIDDNELFEMQRRVVALTKELNRLENSKAINVPVYNAAALPIGNEGDIAIADDTGYKYFNGAWSAMSGGGMDGWTDKVTKAVDESILNSNTLQDDDELFFNTVNGTYYEFDSVIFYNRSGGTSGGINPDFRFGFGEDTITRGHWVGGTWSTNEIASIDGQGVDTDLTRTIGASITSQIRIIKVEGIFRGGGGTLKLKWCPNTVDAVKSMVVQAGSFIRWRHWTV